MEKQSFMGANSFVTELPPFQQPAIRPRDSRGNNTQAQQLYAVGQEQGGALTKIYAGQKGPGPKERR